MSTFAGKVALVTGGTRGLGLAAAHAFVRRGARVVITARAHDQGQQAAEELRCAGGEVHFIPRDIADPATPEALIRETVTTLGGGLGWLGYKYGLASDNLISVDLVTADGKLRVASDTEHPALFWGVRGGGGNLGKEKC